MVTITKSVGQGGVNVIADVRLVQQLVNRNLHLLKTLKPLTEDGIPGPATTRAILEFQRFVMRLQRPDGLVSPGGPTLLGLIKNARQARPPNVAAFLSKALPAAKQVKVKFRIPIAVLIAQAALESGWGQHVKDNAYFGIKGKSSTGGTTTFTTKEFVGGKEIVTKDSFRAYADFSEAAEDYGLYLTTNERYKPCFAAAGDPFAFADKLQTAGYATDPAYATKLKNIMRSYYLEDYDR